jgi:hypothetical protein
MPWSRPITSPITLCDGRVLQTLGDAAKLLAGLIEKLQSRPWNQYAGALLAKAAEPGGTAIRDATMQMQRA